MTARLLSIGRAVPPGALSQREALRLAEQCCAASPAEANRLKRLFENSGIETRQFVVAEPERRETSGRRVHFGSRSASGGDTKARVAAPRVPFFPPRLHDEDLGPTTAERLHVYDRWARLLAQSAASAALRDASCAASRITHLITVSCTGMRAPGVDISLIESLGLPRDVRRAHVGFMGCHAAINALRLASEACRADATAVVLVVCVELCSVHFQYRGDGDCLLANALFADGAAAAVVTADSSSDDAIVLRDFASVVVPDSTNCMSWRIGDHGFEMSLSIDVPARIRGVVRPWVSEWLAGQNLTIEAVGGWAVHPGGPRILDAFAEAVRLPDEALDCSRGILQRFGNMSSPTVLFILDELLRRGTDSPSVIIAFGPGLTIEAGLVG